MPGGLTTRARHAGGGLVRDVLLVLVASVVCGAVGGALWRWLWTPLRGTVLEGTWFPDTNASEFSATGLFVLLGLGLGLLLGVLCGLVTDRREVVVLVLVVAGSLLAAAVMFAIGRIGMPADPARVARSAADGTRLAGTLTVRGWTPFLGWPTGSLLGLFVVFMGLSRKPLDQHPSFPIAG